MAQEAADYRWHQSTAMLLARLGGTTVAEIVDDVPAGESGDAVGSLDTAFAGAGNNGILDEGISGAPAAMVIQPDGTILVAGQSAAAQPPVTNALLACYASGGMGNSGDTVPIKGQFRGASSGDAPVPGTQYQLLTKQDSVCVALRSLSLGTR
jgi:hypothetical protein